MIRALQSRLGTVRSDRLTKCDVRLSLWSFIIRRPPVLRAVALSAWHVLALDWAVHDAELSAALLEAVREGPRRRFWKCSDPLRRRRPGWNPKRIYCVYKATMLNQHRPAKRRFLKRERMPRDVPRLTDIFGLADFISDALACRRRFRAFNVIDDFNREAQHIAVDTSLNAQPLICVFECLQPGLPQVLHTDSEPEFRGEAFVACAKSRGMGIQYIQPGKPNQSAYI